MIVNLFDNRKQEEEKLKFDLGVIREVSYYLASKFEKDDRVELNIIFTGSDHIRQLNKEYRGIDKPTDVLSFSYLSEMDTQNSALSIFTAGEIIICPEAACDNSKKIGKNWNVLLEIIYLIIHGMLHIYDYHHSTEKDRINMERMQQGLLNDVRNTFRI
ncbi:MAG: rRNA maturation RNase YbeY [Actinobacteria bacterium]|nr:rRNA maturation RNase YbeY [Actinomycetota bacterium]